MQLYRIASCKYIDDLTGTGGLYAAGRWHAKGTRIVYFSQHVSLAKLEILVNASFLPRNMCLLTVDVSNILNIETVPQDKLPKGWNIYPYVDELQKTTNEWLSQKKSAILKVPSSQAYNEYNYLFNPLHKDANDIKIISKESVSFDNRLKL